jgi:hypothetical protein
MAFSESVKRGPNRPADCGKPCIIAAPGRGQSHRIGRQALGPTTGHGERSRFKKATGDQRQMMPPVITIASQTPTAEALDDSLVPSE